MDLNTETLQNQHNTGREMAGLVMLRLGESYEGGVISHFPSYWYFFYYLVIYNVKTHSKSDLLLKYINWFKYFLPRPK